MRDNLIRIQGYVQLSNNKTSERWVKFTGNQPCVGVGLLRQAKKGQEVIRSLRIAQTCLPSG